MQTPTTLFTDKLIHLVSGVGNPAYDKTAGAELAFEAIGEELAANLYRTSWMARAIVDEPAHDMTRAWRNWQGSETEIETVRASERALRLRSKVHNAVQLARLFGRSAIFIGTGGDTASPITGTVSAGAIQYLHVFKGADLKGAEPDTDLASANFGGHHYYDYEPFSVGGEPLEKVRIHSSRLIWFRGATEPQDLATGQSVLQACYQPIIDSEVLLAHVQALVGEAKLDVIKVRDLASTLSGGMGPQTDQLRPSAGTCAAAP